jgi:hypothetical protein
MERNFNFIKGDVVIALEDTVDLLKDNEYTVVEGTFNGVISVIDENRVILRAFASRFKLKEGKKIDPSVREFESGAVRDTGNKEDYVETISYLALKRYAEYMTQQAKKYGRGNWRKGIPIESYEESLMRHIQKYFANKYDDAQLEPEVDHLSACLFNLFGIIHELEKEKINKK